MNSEIDELKGLVLKNIELTQETNRMLHKMHRSVWWGRFFQIVWWVAIFAVSGAAYYYYLQPYVATLEQAYGNTRNFETQVQDFFKRFGQPQSQQSSPGGAQ